MAMKYLGETLDIHAGGVDLTFPHHENEIAQSEALTGKPFARFWLHSEHLSIDGQKMSKSLGNFYTLRDMLAMGYAPEAIRYLLASVPYRKKLNFTFDGLKAAATSIDRLRNYKLRLETAKFADGTNEKLVARTDAATKAFNEALDDDLNTAEALAAVFEYIRDTNTAMDAGEFLAGNAPGAFEFLTHFDSVFDVLKPSDSAPTDYPTPTSKRKSPSATPPKKRKDFARADQIRKDLAAEGIVLEDTKEGVRWKRSMKIETKAVHVGDRKRGRRLRARHHADLHRHQLRLRFDGAARPRFRRRGRGPVLRPLRQSDARRARRIWSTNSKAEHGAIACASGMSALHLGILAALLDRPKRVVAANALYGATTNLLMSVFGPMGVETTFVDICDLAAVRGSRRREPSPAR